MSDLRLTVLMVRPSDQVYFGPCVGGLQIADQALKGQGQPSHRFFAIHSRLPRPPSASRDVRDLPSCQPAGRPSYAALATLGSTTNLFFRAVIRPPSLLTRIYEWAIVYIS